MHLRLIPDHPHAEIVHHADDEGTISSRGRRVRIEHGGEVTEVALPLRPIERLASRSRLARRLLRTDKSVILPAGRIDRFSSIVAIYRGTVYHIEPPAKAVLPVLTLEQSRNPLHGGVARAGDGSLFFGEYAANPDRGAVPVYRSKDEGRSWERVFAFEPGEARHVHGCFWDPYEERVWTCTGDFEGENHILISDVDFERVERLGDGSQLWRTCFLAFTPDHVFWGMDSQLEPSWICRMDRATRAVERIQEVPGPIWYGKQLADGTLLLASSVEKGPSVRTRRAVVWASRDGDRWEAVHAAPKDIFPMPWFKNGVIAFAEGKRSDGSFHMFGEALVGLDGRAVRCVLAP